MQKVSYNCLKNIKYLQYTRPSRRFLSTSRKSDPNWPYINHIIEALIVFKTDLITHCCNQRRKVYKAQKDEVQYNFNHGY